MDVIRVVVIVVFIAIVASLGHALYLLAGSRHGPDEGRSARMARALTWRIGLSIVLFLFLLVAWRMGLIAPHGVGR